MALDHRKKEIGKAFASSLNSNLSDLKGAASSILEAYNVNPNREENDQASFLAILRFCQDIVFQAPAVILAKEWVPDAAYLFQFCAPNPWSGPWQGMASHIIDLVHLWQNFDGYLPEAQQRVGKAMGSDLIRFAYGKAPWSTDGQYSSVAKEYGIRDSEEPKYGVAREGPIWDLMDRFGADRVLGAADNFLVGL